MRNDAPTVDVQEMDGNIVRCRSVFGLDAKQLYNLSSGATGAVPRNREEARAILRRVLYTSTDGALEEDFGRAVHLEHARGDAKANTDYCLKEETKVPWEAGGFDMIIGEPSSGQGARTELQGFVDSVKEGATDQQILEAYPKEFIKYGNAMQRIRSAMAEPRRKKPHVTLYWGPTGTGKSLRAHTDHPDAYVKTAGNKWWDGYKTGQSVIFDDYDDSQQSITYLLTLLDHYRVQTEVS